jgi:hypothetical protein
MQGVRGSNPLSSTRHNASAGLPLKAACQQIVSRSLLVVALELMVMVDTSGLQPQRRPRDRAAAAQDGQATPGDPAPRGREHRQRRLDLPLLRHQPPVLLYLAPALPRPRPGRAPGPVPPAPDQPQCHPHRGGGQDHLPAPALPLRAGQDRHVPQTLPRDPDRQLRGLAHPEAARAQPTPGLPTPPAPRPPLAAL